MTEIISLGNKIEFKTKNENDNVSYVGVVKANIIDHEIALGISDVDSYNRNVIKSDHTVPTDLTALNFFIVEIIAGDNEKRKVAFAKEWIRDSSLKLINNYIKRTIFLHDFPENNPETIVEILNKHGYTNVQIKDENG